MPFDDVFALPSMAEHARGIKSVRLCQSSSQTLCVCLCARVSASACPPPERTLGGEGVQGFRASDQQMFGRKLPSVHFRTLEYFCT